MKNNIDVYLNAVEDRLEQLCDAFFYNNSRVASAAKYSLLKAGKRTRALLILMCADMCGGDWHNYVDFASGVEMIHCYSLIHDDLPCMDDDDYRRGKPSCHIAYDYATALLAGDALLGCGVQAMANCDCFDSKYITEAVKRTTQAMGPQGMVYGQELDLEYENKPADADMLYIIHRNKTGMMISLCGELGSIATDINEKQKKAIEVFFSNTGLIFQIVDDILDVTSTSEKLGKPINSDAGNNKSTFVTVFGLEESRKISKKLADEANDTLYDAFGDKSADLLEYTDVLLNREK